jgi:hypothetical protein
MEINLKWRHKKTGYIACWMGTAINKSDNNRLMVVYCPEDDGDMYAMNEIDFLQRFEPNEIQS